jgi:hypothetical protein
MTPEENRPINTEKQPKTRRTVRLPAPEQQERPAARQEQYASTPPHRTAKDGLLRVAELVVADWAPTLREAALRIVLFAVVLTVLGIAFGGGIALLGVVLGFVMFLVGRRREPSAK